MTASSLTFCAMTSTISNGPSSMVRPGGVKVLLEKGKDRILGVTLVARHAGDMISEMTLAMEAGVGLGRLSSVIHPYPTQSEAFKKLGDEYKRQRLKPWLKRWLERFFAWRR